MAFDCMKFPPSSGARQYTWWPLIACDCIPHQVPWMYVNVEGLLNFLSARIDLGYAMPLNPKWVLCDPGWWVLYRKLITSPNRWTREACNAWLPSWSGLRERLEQLHERYPRGFVRNEGSDIGAAMDPWMDPDLAEYKLERYRVLQRAKKKLRSIFVMLTLIRGQRAKRRLNKVVNAVKSLRRANLLREAVAKERLERDLLDVENDPKLE